MSSGDIDYSTASVALSYVPVLNTGHTDNMSFLERGLNLYWKLLNGFYMGIQIQIGDIMIRRNLGEMPPSTSMIANLSGALINSNPVLEHSILQPATFLNVGGLQIKTRDKLGKLAPDVQVTPPC